MPMIELLLNWRAQKRAIGDAISQSEGRKKLSYAQLRSRRYRRTLLFVFIMFGVVSFVEVVLLPGEMIRRNLNPPTKISPVANDSVDDDYHFPTWLMSDEQRNAQRQKQRDQIEKRLRDDLATLGAERTGVKQGISALEASEHDELGLIVSDVASQKLPQQLTDVLSNEPTAQAAWASLTNVKPHVVQLLSDTKDLQKSVSIRLDSETFLESDVHDMAASVRELRQAKADLQHSQDYVEHISILRRARASLARQDTLDKQLGELK